MAFRFKFQAILNLKTRIEDLKKVKFGEANEELSKQNEKLKVLIEEREMQYKLMKEKNEKDLTVKAMVAYNNYMNRLKKSIEIQKIVVEKAKVEVEKARLELVDATKAKKMFETLKEKKLEEYWEDYYKKEQIALDEIVSYKYNGGEKDGTEE